MTSATKNQRPVRDPWNIGFGAVASIAALLALLVWIPNDIKGGFIEINQIGKPEPGDAFFPIILASIMLVLSVGQLIEAVFSSKSQAASGKLTFNNFKFLFVFYSIVFTGLAIMFWFGPLVVDALRAFGVIDSTYRQLVDTAPYKYLGYMLGGFLMTTSLIAWAEGSIRPQAMLIVIIVMGILILVLDILLYNIQIPPNADF